MRILIAGLGSIGRRYASILREHNITALRSRRSISPLPYVKEVYTVEDAIKSNPGAALICTPTHLHIPLALHLGNMGVPLLIEKPISNSLSRLDELLEVVDRNRLTVYIAYPFRFHHGVQSARSLCFNDMFFRCSTNLHSWRPYPTYSYRWDEGGGALLDIASHELDIATYLCGPIRVMWGKLSHVGGVTEDADDHAWVKWWHDNGVTGEARVFLDGTEEERGALFNTITDHGAHTIATLNLRDSGEMYRAQMKYFLANLNNPKLMNNIIEAAPLFRTIIGFRESHKPERRGV